MGNDELYEIEVYYLHQTDAAILVNEDGDTSYDAKGIWLPKSQINWDDDRYERGTLITIEAPEWLLKDKGLTF